MNRNDDDNMQIVVISPRTSYSGPQYHASFGEDIMRYALGGQSEAMWARNMGISIEKLKQWRKDHTEFADAYEVALTNFRALWEQVFLEQTRTSIPGRTATMGLLQAIAPEDWARTAVEARAERASKSEDEEFTKVPPDEAIVALLDRTKRNAVKK